MNKKTTFQDGIERHTTPCVSYKDIFQKYVAVAEIFTLPQWEALTLCLGERLTQTEVGRRIGIKRRAVGSRLERAKKRLVEHQKKLRAERFA